MVNPVAATRKRPPERAKGEHMISDEISLRKFVNTHRSIIYGMMLGDSGISQRGRASRFGVWRCLDQEDYLWHKHKLLQDVAEEVKRYVNEEKGREYFYFSTCSGVEWQKVWSTFHQDSVKKTVGNTTYIPKVVTRQILSALDDHGVALWFMDDGHLSCWLHPSGTRYQQFFKLSTCGFTDRENELIIEWMKERYGIKARLAHQRNKIEEGVYRTYPFICLGREAYRVIRDRIAPFVPECMDYKIDIKDPPLSGQGRLPDVRADEDALRASGKPEEATGNESPASSVEVTK